MSFSQLFDAQKKSFGLGLALILAILATRTQHFGSAAYLPDATLAVLFLGGLLIVQRGWLALAIISAFAMDAYAIGWMGVSDYCMSPAYWGLIPTYAMVWGAGRWLAKHAQPFALLSYAATGWAAASAAFIVSNAFWYQFSGRFAEMPVSDFVQRVSQYYTPYVGYSVMYLGVAWAVHRFIIGFTQPKTSRV